MRWVGTFAAAVVLAFAAGDAGTAQTPPPAPAATAPSTFVYDQSCLDSGARAGFAVPGTWDLPSLIDGTVGQIWIDLSLYNNGFAPGTFIGAGPFVPQGGAITFGWEGLEVVARHYYRLNALSNARWIEIGRGTFETINCGPVRAMGCNVPDGAVSVEFAVSPAGMFGGRAPVAHWFDLTLFGNPRNLLLDNGFSPGTFVSAGLFPPAGTIFAWSGIKPNARHYYRQNTFYGGTTWNQQFSSSFVSLDCRHLPAFSAPG